jgi:hypothetical protein
MTTTTTDIQSAVIAAMNDRPFIGTVSRPDLDDRAGLMAADQVIRHIAPKWLWLAGLNAQGDALAVLPELTSWANVAGSERLAREALRAAEAARAHCGVRSTIAWEEPKRRAVGDAMFTALHLSGGRKVRRAAQVAAQAAGEKAAWKALDAVWRASAAAALVAGWDGESTFVGDEEQMCDGGGADDALHSTAVGLRAEADALLDRMASLWANLK